MYIAKCVIVAAMQGMIYQMFMNNILTLIYGFVLRSVLEEPNSWQLFTLPWLGIFLCFCASGYIAKGIHSAVYVTERGVSTVSDFGKYWPSYTETEL